MSRSSGRGQTEPLAALVAVGAICLALSLYAGVLDASLHGSPDRDVAAATVDRAADRVASDGIASPERLTRAAAFAPDGYELNVSLSVGDRRWHVGPRPPEGADTARRRVPVRVDPACLRPGLLEVAIWQ